MDNGEAVPFSRVSQGGRRKEVEFSILFCLPKQLWIVFTYVYGAASWLVYKLPSYQKKYLLLFRPLGHYNVHTLTGRVCVAKWFYSHGRTISQLGSGL